MTDLPITTSTASDRARDIRAAVESRLKIRHASERRFKLYGQLAIAIALSFLVLLLGRIVTQGASTFVVHSISVQVPLDPARIDQTALEGVNYDLMVADAILAKLGEKDDDFGTKSEAVKDLMSPDFGFQLLNMLKADSGLIGKTVTVSGPLRANADLYFKGEIKRASPEEERTLSNQQLDWLDALKSSGAVTTGFNIGFFTKSDSTEPEQAGVLGAVVVFPDVVQGHQCLCFYFSFY